MTISSSAATDRRLTLRPSGTEVARTGRHETSGQVAPTRSTRPYISLFWRLFLPNAAVVVGSGIARWIHPVHGEAWPWRSRSR